MSFKEDLNGILGINKTTPELPASNTLAQLIGLGTGIGGIVGAVSTDIPAYSNQLVSQLEGIQADQKAVLDATTADFNASMDAMGKRLESSQLAGLKARGIEDKAVAEETGKQIKSGVSGAIAAAAAALEGAKYKAKSTLAQNLAQYNIRASQKQYESAYNEYAAKKGIWSALGGAAGAMLAVNTEPKQLTPDESESMTNRLLNTEDSNKASTLTDLKKLDSYNEINRGIL